MKRLIPLIVATMFLSACAFCSEENIREVKSPNGGFVATLFMRDCGATGSPVFHVNLRAENSKFLPDTKGAIEGGAVLYSARYGRDIKIAWKDEKNLLIECSECTVNQSLHVEKKWGDINISYQGSQSSK